MVIDKKDYIQKMNQLLEDNNTYRLLKMDPTNKNKNRLINILRRIKSEGRLEEGTYKKMYPTGASSPKLYGLPKIHKKDIPLRLVVSSQGSVSYGVAKELARILKPLSGNNNHQVLNSKEFADDIKKMKLEEGECIMSYNVAALFTSIPVKPAIEVVKKKLEQDTELHQRTTMSTQNILDLEFCLCSTYFLFQGHYYEQTQGAAMGSPVSPVLANLYMEFFEDRALSTAVNPPRWWKRFVDDTFVILKKDHKEEFLQHINSVDPSIQFTTEEQKEDGSMPFLDILVTPQEDGTLTSKVYRKPTHTDQYLQWDSHHNLACKYGVINTLTHRAKAVCSNSQLLKEELHHLEGALTKCKYPRWAFQKVLKDQESKKNKKEERNTPIQKRCHIVVPFTKGLCESYKSICGKYGVQAYFRGGSTLKNLLMFPKDKDEMKKQSNIIYWYRCGRTECNNEYSGESDRTFEERFKEHLKAPSPFYEHENMTGDKTSVENFKIIGREGHGISRTIQETIYIRVNKLYSQQKCGQIQPATYLGQSSVHHPRTQN